MFINLVAPINNLGYGVVGFNITKALNALGHAISLFPLGNQASWENNPGDIEMLQRCVNNAQFLHFKAPSVRIWHQDDMAMFPGSGERIGWPIFELDRFTEKELHHLEGVDRLFVCSKWAKNVVLKSIPDAKVDVVPLGVDPTIFFLDNSVKRPYWSANTTTFINVGKWENRKGHNELLEAFCRAFTPSDNVELIMLNENPFIGLENEKWKMKYLSSPMGQKIKIKQRMGTQADMRRLFNQADFGVFPSHAEGWNLEPLELMACGVPNIITNYSGHTEFCNEKNSLLVEPNGMVKAFDGRDGSWFNGQGDWCDFSIDDLMTQMRKAHEMKMTNSDELKSLKEAAINTAREFSWENSAKIILGVL